VYAICLAEEGQVKVVVDDEQGAGGSGEVAEAASQRQLLATCQDLVAELEDLGAPAQGRTRQVGKPIGLLVRGDDVKARRLEAPEKEVSDCPVNLPSREAARRRCALAPLPAPLRGEGTSSPVVGRRSESATRSPGRPPGP
jgi:hypothetical protein